MRFNRTGWNLYEHDGFIDVTPQDDLKEHLVGDECWCNPRVLRENDALPIVSHNSADKRELNEPDNWQYEGIMDATIS